MALSLAEFTQIAGATGLGYTKAYELYQKYVGDGSASVVTLADFLRIGGAAGLPYAKSYELYLKHTAGAFTPSLTLADFERIVHLAGLSSNKAVEFLAYHSAESEPMLIAVIGQSNATGRGDVAGTDRGLDLATTYTNALIAQKTSDATTNPIGWDFDYEMRTLRPYRAGGSPGMGIELSAGRYMRNHAPAFKGDTLPSLAKYAVNGSGLATWWLPSLPDDAVLPGTDNLYNQFVTWVRDQETATGLTLGAIIWIQGEADATDATNAGNYAENMEELFTALQAEFGSTIQLVMNKLHVDCPETHTSTVRTQQDTFADGKSTVHLVDCDDIPLPAGDAHFGGDSLVTLGNRLAEATLEALYPGRVSDRVEAEGSFIQGIDEPCDRGAGALTPRIPVHAAGDDLFLVVATAALDAEPTTPAGWTQVISDQSETGGNFINVCVYHKRAVAAGTTAPAVADTNAKNVAMCFTVRGGAASPIEAAESEPNNAYNVTVTLPSVTTLGTNRLIINIAAGFSGDPNLAFSGWTNAALDDYAEFRDGTLNVGGDGMFIALAAGYMAAEGATGASVVTPSNISINCGVTLAIKA